MFSPVSRWIRRIWGGSNYASFAIINLFMESSRLTHMCKSAIIYVFSVFFRDFWPYSKKLIRNI